MSAMPQPKPAPDREALKVRIAALARAASLETAARERAVAETLSANLVRGTVVYITHLPGDTREGTIAAARRLADAGLLPVPHIAARALRSFGEADDFLGHLAGVGAVGALAIAGDQEEPAGPFASSLALLATGLFEKHGIRRIAVAAYPEGHRKIAPIALEAALGAKLALARARGFAAEVVTQFCFDAVPILTWMRRFAARAEPAPVRIGLAGPAAAATLARYAMRCGIGNSLLALGRQPSLARLIGDAGPERIIRTLAAEGAIGGEGATLHLFTFGGVARAARWLAAVARGEFELSGEGFHVSV